MLVRYSPPCITARRVAASSTKCCEATDLTQPGWFSFCSQSENHPGLAISGGFATSF